MWSLARSLRHGILVAIAVLAVAPSAPGQPANADTWTGASTSPLTAPNANWQDAGNWLLAAVPTSANTAYFASNGGGFTSISLGGAPPSIAAIQFDTGAVSYTIGSDNTDTLTIATNNISSTVGAISVTSGVTNAQAINSNITFGAAATAPLVTNASSTSPLTLGASPGSATITPASGTTSLTVTVSTGATIAINDVIAGNVGGTVSGTTAAGGLSLTLGSGSTGTIVLNAQNTYAGVTNLNSAVSNLTLQIGSSTDTASSATYTKGPFGVSTLVFNGNGVQTFLQAVGADQTIANPLYVIGGNTFSSAATPHSLTFAGPISYNPTASRSLLNNMAAGTTLTLGASANSSTITLSPTSSIILNFTGSGATVVNDSIVDNALPPATANGITVNASGPVTFNGTQSYSGALTLSGTSFVTINGVKSGPGALTVGNTGGVLLNAASTFTGGTMLTGTSVPVRIGISTVPLSGSSVTSGPFGTGTLTPNNGSPPILEPFGASQTVANAINMSSGFFVQNPTLAQDPTGPNSLTLTGAVTDPGKVMTNNMIAGAALTFGTPGTSTLFTMGAADTFQSQSGAGVTVFNDVITGAFSFTVKQGGTYTLTNANTYTGGTNGTQVMAGGTLGAGATLLVNNTSGSGTGTSKVTVTGSGGPGGTGGSSAVGTGGTLGGSGTITPAAGNVVTIGSTTAATQGGIILPGPGNSVPGTLTVGSMTWNPYAQYTFLHDATNSNPPNVPSPGLNSFINGSGNLSLANLSGSAPFNINLLPVNFSSTPTPMTYTLATFTGGIFGPGATQYNTGVGVTSTDVSALFTVNGTSTNVPATMYAAVVGASTGPQSLQLTFTPVPEPAFILAACGGLTALVGWRRRIRPR